MKPGERIRITDRSEKILQQSSQFLQSTIDALQSHLAILDESGHIIAVNRAWREFADANCLNWDGYGVGRNYLESFELTSFKDAMEIRAALKGIREVMTRQRSEFSLEYPCHSTEEKRWFLMHVTHFEENENLRIVVNHTTITGRKLAEEALKNSHDKLELRVQERTAKLANTTELLRQEIEERRQAEEAFKKSQFQLIQSQKMEALGILVAGVAHELNNPNNFITFNLPILKDYLEKLIPIIDKYVEEHQDFEIFGMTYSEFRNDIFLLLKNLEHGSLRINKIVSALKEFSRKKVDVVKKWIDIKQTVESAVILSQGKVAKEVKTFDVDIPNDMPQIYTDPILLEQILVNLLINAAQASNKENSWVKLSMKLDCLKKKHLLIEVSDNGCGMDEETQYKIFDPFFTTQPDGKGTGLGLSLCQNLISALGGNIEIDSEVGWGSTFRLILPFGGQNRKVRNNFVSQYV